ncbi:MAG: hypothetical protein M3461_16515 [Pseudomonadota bacterium]|nr:hypothetical protein [Pseudomonadota bacterium]
MLGEYVPTARTALAALRTATAESRYHVVGDPAVRSTINSALAHYKLGGPEFPMEETEALLSIATRHLSENSCVAPLAVGAPTAKRLGDLSYYAWVWCDERDEDLPAQTFRRLFYKQEVGRSALWTPNDDAHKMLANGTRLLTELLPELARSALNHVHLVVLLHIADRTLWNDDRYRLPFDSFSTGIIPGTIFLSRAALKDVWHVAEYLLHEALHQKHHDLEHTHSMLRRGYSAADSPRTRALWNRCHSYSSNEWPVCRAVAAFHVYVHLALFFKGLDCRAPELEGRYGSLNGFNPALAARRAVDRAHYLGQRIKEVDYELGFAGQRFVDWLLEALAALGPHPEASDPIIHLLDLYDAELEEIKMLIASSSRATKGTHSLQVTDNRKQTARDTALDLIRTELTMAHEVSSLLGSAPPQQCPNGDAYYSMVKTLSQRTDVELASIFEAARTYVYSSLRMLSPGILSSPCQSEPAKSIGHLLQETIDYSGNYLTVFSY